MTKITLYGGAKSRAIRSLWAIEEAGIDYEHIPIKSLDEMRCAEFLAINRNGKIPALVDGELTVFESMCINLYLAEHYAAELYSAEVKTRVAMMQWSFWAISEIEPLQMDILNNTKFLPKEKRIPEIAERAHKRIKRPLRVLEEALAAQPWLAGSQFSIADLNVASVLLLLDMTEFDYAEFPQTRRWLDKCFQRPAHQAAQNK